MQKLLPNFLRTTGLALILVGMVAAYYGPLEIYVFYFFSDGGRFHYDGFGVGSDLIRMMGLPAYEVDFLNRIVLLQDYPLVGLLTGPLLAGIGLAIYSRRYFRIDRRASKNLFTPQSGGMR